MPAHCSAFGCLSRDSKELRAKGITFHKFPKDSALKKEWVLKMKRITSHHKLWQPSNSAVICSNHFLKDDFLIQFGRKTVKSGIIPSIFTFSKELKQIRKQPKQRQCSTSFIENDNNNAESTQLIEENNNTIIKEKIDIIHNYSMPNRQILNKRVTYLRQIITNKNKQIAILKQNKKRKMGKIANLIEKLKINNLSNSVLENKLECFKDINLNIFNFRKFTNYNNEQKKFATTLFYYSPSAYSYVKSQINLPNPRTIRRWLTVYDASPGLTFQSFETIALRAKQDRNFQICTIQLDEMEIKKHLQFDRSTKQIHGYVNIGCGPLDDDSQPVATKVLVVLAVGLLGHWKMPLGYYLTDGTNSDFQSSILTNIIIKLHEGGTCVLAITFDCHAANVKTLELLGGSIKYNNINSLVPHPTIQGFNVAILFDVCHLIKLFRNLFADYTVIITESGKSISWQHILNLYEIQTKEEIRFGNRLTKQHIEWKAQKMKVRLAVQTLSASVGNALKYLRLSGVAGFEDTEETENFIFIINKLFDILNSHSTFSKGYKKAINSYNWLDILSYFNYTQNYLLNLTTKDGIQIIKTKRRICILGIIATMNSVSHIVNNFILNTGFNNIQIKYLPTYKLSQDHIEMFFALIRRRGGWNNNPTSLQFSYAYRAILSNIGVVLSKNSNVLSLDATDLITCRKNLDDCDEFSNYGKFNDTFIIDTHFINNINLSNLIVNACAYISGFILKKILFKITCIMCRDLLLADKDSFCTSHFLINIKDSAEFLFRPSDFLLHLITIVEKIYRSNVDKLFYFSKFSYQFENSVLQNIQFNKFPNSISHMNETIDGIDNHVFSLSKLIVRKYIEIKLFDYCKNRNLQLKGKNIRQTLSKIILFKNQ